MYWNYWLRFLIKFKWSLLFFTGIYNESYRKSCWIFIDDHQQPVMQDSIDEVDENGLDDDDNKTGKCL